MFYAPVFLARGKGLFGVERMRGEITEIEQFDGSVYVTVDLDGGDVMRQRLL